MKVSKQEREEALASIKKFVKPADTVYTVIRSVSRSGMSRRMDVYAFYLDEKKKIQKQYLTGWCVKLGLGSQSIEQWRKGAGMSVNGCGMDMGFHVVYSLSRILFADGFGVKSEGGIVPKSKEHAAQLVSEGKTKFYGRNGDTSGWDNDGGYALRHEWI